MRSIEEIIQKAIQDGEFDNLPGKGKPLALDDNPFLDPEWQLAYHLLKQNGFAPQFIEQRQVIEVELGAAREALSRTWAWRLRELERGKEVAFVEAQWTKAKFLFQSRIEKINQQIKSNNLQAPTPLLTRLPIKFENELARIENAAA